MNKIITTICSFFAIISSLIVIFVFGKSKGKAEEKQKNTADSLKVSREFKKDDDVVADKSNDDIRAELRTDARN
jgi:hypothetical protein